MRKVFHIPRQSSVRTGMLNLSSEAATRQLADRKCATGEQDGTNQHDLVQTDLRLTDDQAANR
jgi:hypothetical protein